MLQQKARYSIFIAAQDVHWGAYTVCTFSFVHCAQFSMHIDLIPRSDFRWMECVWSAFVCVRVSWADSAEKWLKIISESVGGFSEGGTLQPTYVRSAYISFSIFILMWYYRYTFSGAKSMCKSNPLVPIVQKLKIHQLVFTDFYWLNM